MSIDICENQQLINNFQERLGTSQHKELLVSILNNRLNGNFHIGYNSNDDNLSFDFKDTLNEEQIAVLHIFTELYHTFPLVNIEYMTIIAPIISLIKKNYNNTMTLMNSNNLDFRPCLFHFKNYGETSFELNKILEWSLIIPKLDRLEIEIKKTYKSLLSVNFVIKDLISKNKSLQFSEVYQIINNYIRDNLCKNIKNDNNRENIFNLDIILNRIFWIVYADDFKFIDNVQKMYTISDDKFEEFQEKMLNDPKFNYENCDIMENGTSQIININMIENFAKQVTKAEENIEKIFDDILQNYTNNDDKNMVVKKLEEGLDNYLKTNVRDSEEIAFYKSLFSVNIGFRMLGRGIDLSEIIRKI